jgi:hypothetical protein
MTMELLASALRNSARYEEARAVYLAGLDAAAAVAVHWEALTSITLEFLGGLAMCNRALGRCDDELDNLREIYAKSKAAYGQRHEKMYAAALRLSDALLEQYYVSEALSILPPLRSLTIEDLGEDHELTLGLAHTYLRAIWLYHFFGHKGYREHLCCAVKGLIPLLLQAKDVFGSWEDKYCEEIQDTLRRVLAHQLDWSLDDLELNSTERQLVDLLLEDPDYAKF